MFTILSQSMRKWRAGPVGLASLRTGLHFRTPVEPLEAIPPTENLQLPRLRIRAGATLLPLTDYSRVAESQKLGGALRNSVVLT